MKQNVKLITKYLLYGISYGCTFFVINCWLMYLTDGAAALMPVMQNFSQQAAGAILTGIACGSTAIVYKFDRLPLRYKVLIHFVIGIGTFYPMAIYLKWIPFYPGDILYTAIQLLITCGIFAVIWLAFFLYEYIEAKSINKKLKEISDKDTH